MLGLFSLGLSFLYGVAIAASLAVAVTVVASLTLLPALLGFFGRRILPRRLRDVDFPEAAIPEVVDHALDDWSITRVPRPVNREEFTRLLEAAW